MGRKNMAVRRNDPETLILRFLTLRRTEEFSTGILGLANLVEVDGNGHKVGSDLPDDGLVGERTRTESCRISSTPLQGVISSNPEEEGTPLSAGEKLPF